MVGLFVNSCSCTVVCVLLDVAGLLILAMLMKSLFKRHRRMMRMFRRALQSKKNAYNQKEDGVFYEDGVFFMMIN